MFKMPDEEHILRGPPEDVKDFTIHSLGQLLLNRIKLHGSGVAQVNAYTGEEQTYEEILNASVKLAIYLRKGGINKDDRIAICSENNAEFCIPLCAAMYLGATVCPLNPLYSEMELNHALHISKPKYVFVSSTSARIIQKMISCFNWSPKVVILNKVPNVDLPNMQDITSDIDKDEIRNFQACQVNVYDHVAAILCSSGTTGLPKGVMLTDMNMLTVIKHVIDSNVEVFGDNTVMLSLLPFFHAYSFAVLIVRLVIGATSVILSRFDEEVFLRTIEKYKIDNLTVVPPLMIFLAKHPLVDKYDLSSVKSIWCGAAPLSAEILNTVKKRLNVVDIKQGYGLTETTLAVLRTPEGNKKQGSVGVLAPGTLGKVMSIDENSPGKTMGPNQIGELCFKGNLIMKGYCNDDTATMATIDADGWLHTGDVGYYDKDGYFYIVDRIKELIKYKGFQVPPAELEALLLTYPGVKDAAVIGVPHEEAGELPLAFVVKQDNCNVTEEEIIRYVNERVSSPKRLRGGVRFIKELPRTASGKILRRVLRNSLNSKL